MNEDARLAELLHHPIRQVADALRRPPRQEYHIVRERLSSRFELRRIVRYDAERHRLSAKLPHGIGQDDAVTVIDKARLHGLAWSNQLVTRGQNGDTRPAARLGAGQSQRGKDSRFTSTEQLSPTQNGLALADVGTGEVRFVPGVTGRLTSNWSCPSTSVYSIMTTALAPRGIIAPVASGTADPGSTIGNAAGIPGAIGSLAMSRRAGSSSLHR